MASEKPAASNRSAGGAEQQSVFAFGRLFHRMRSGRSEQDRSGILRENHLAEQKFEEQIYELGFLRWLCLWSGRGYFDVPRCSNRRAEVEGWAIWLWAGTAGWRISDCFGRRRATGIGSGDAA